MTSLRGGLRLFRAKFIFDTLVRRPESQYVKKMSSGVVLSDTTNLEYAEKKLKSSNFVTLRYKKVTENAYAPTRGSQLAAGYDLYSAYDTVVSARGKALVKTDIQIALPDGCYGRIAPRSGLAWKHSIDVGAGVIDQDYRGNVGVILFNFSDDDFQVKKGDRVAQLICERIYLPTLVESESLDDTARGDGGFGSTGKN